MIEDCDITQPVKIRARQHLTLACSTYRVISKNCTLIKDTNNEITFELSTGNLSVAKNYIQFCGELALQKRKRLK